MLLRSRCSSSPFRT